MARNPKVKTTDTASYSRRLNLHQHRCKYIDLWSHLTKGCKNIRKNLRAIYFQCVFWR